LTTITPGSADKKIDALSLQRFLKFVSVNPDWFSWKVALRLLKTVSYEVLAFFLVSAFLDALASLDLKL